VVTTDEIIPFSEEWSEDDIGTDLRAGSAKNQIFEHLNSGWRLTLHRYRTAAGALILIIVRLDAPDGSDKFIRPLRVARRVGSCTKLEARGLEPLRPLYGLDRLASAPGANVLLVEGEKAADAGQVLFPALTVMTWCGGAPGVAQADWRPLAGRNTIIWPDNDGAGRTAAREVAKALARVEASSIRMVEPPSWFPKKWDLANPVPSRSNG
jgi:hypothetical protein